MEVPDILYTYYLYNVYACVYLCMQSVLDIILSQECAYSHCLLNATVFCLSFQTKISANDKKYFLTFFFFIPYTNKRFVYVFEYKLCLLIYLFFSIHFNYFLNEYSTDRFNKKLNTSAKIKGDFEKLIN